ncbi:Small integral membrane protein 14 [Halotydeus destructor]|nr:Small integral membrane protein 14 [Halotydeus destructor]
MADNFDPCECLNILNHEGRMQRLINMLRSSQSDCTDNECTDGSFGLPGLNGGSDSQTAVWTVMIGWIVLAVILYFMRSGNRRDGQLKSNSNNGPNRNGGQDPAPVF